MAGPSTSNSITFCSSERDFEVPMDGKAFAKGYYQGVKRSLVDVFKDFVDMDDLMKQLKDME